MDHYLDFRLLPDPEFPAPLLMSALFAKLHRVLVQLDNRTIGISFPDVTPDKPILGQRLRLHGTAGDLGRLMAEDWLTGMRDHVTQTEISAVPADAGHRRIRRVQPKSNAERLRRRYARRHPELSEETVAERVPAREEHLKLPFLRVKSQSNGNSFCLFLEHLPLQPAPAKGTFNAYGLSADATVPWF